MTELLINVFCPPTSKSYDFWIPKSMTVEKAISLICDDICELENNPQVFSDRNTLLLCSYLKGKALTPSLTLEQNGIKSGDRLGLV